MIDTHCHLDSPAFDPDREEVLARARHAGITDIVVPAIGPAGWEPLLEWASGRAGIHVALGIHPQMLPELDPADDDRNLARLGELLASGGAIGVGECGLDGPTTARVPMDRQLRVFEAHLALARKHRKPLLIHCLRAHDDLMELFRRSPPPPSVMHSYSGSAEQARQYGAWDLWFSFAGAITYENARKPAAAARAIQRERLLVETDAPDQTPRPYRGRCEPAHMARTVERLAEVLGIAPAEAGALTTANARVALGIARGDRES